MASGRAPTLQLAALDGVWAAVYRRRDRLEAKAAEQVVAAWRPLVADLDLTAVMLVLRQQLDLGESQSAAAADQRRHVLQVTTAAVLAQLVGRTRRPGWPLLIAALTTALARSRAAGRAAGAAVIADDPDQLGDDEDRDEEPEGDGDPAVGLGAAYTITAAALRGTAQAIARALLTTAERGGGLPAMKAAADAVLADATAWAQAATTAAAAAFTAGQTDAYLNHGVEQLDFVTAGDGRVCPTCSDAEDGNPWPPASFPAPPLHPNCRCTPQPAT